MLSLCIRNQAGRCGAVWVALGRSQDGKVQAEFKEDSSEPQPTLLHMGLQSEGLYLPLLRKFVLMIQRYLCFAVLNYKLRAVGRSNYFEASHWRPCSGQVASTALNVTEESPHTPV